MKLTAIPADTTPEAFWVQLDVYRRMTPSQRLRQTLQLCDGMRELAASGVRKRHPQYSDEQVQLAVTRLWIGEELFHKAYPDVTFPS